MKDGIIFTILLIVWTVIKLVFKLIWVIVKVLATLFLFFGLYIPLFYSVFGIILLATTDFTLGVMGTDQVLFYIGLGLCGVASVIITIRNLIVRPFSAIFAPFLEYRDEIKKERDKFRKDAPEQGAQGDPRTGGVGYDPYYAQNSGYPPYGDPYAAQRYPFPQQQYPPQPGYPYQQDGQMPYSPRHPYDARPDYSPRDAYGAADSMPPPPAPPYYGGGEGSAYPPRYPGEQQPMAPDVRQDPYSREPYPSPQSRGFSPAPERPLVYHSKRRPGILVKEYSDRFELYDESDGTRRYIGTEYKDE